MSDLVKRLRQRVVTHGCLYEEAANRISELERKYEALAEGLSGLCRYASGDGICPEPQLHEEGEWVLFDAIRDLLELNDE